MKSKIKGGYPKQIWMTQGRDFTTKSDGQPYQVELYDAINSAIVDGTVFIESSESELTLIDDDTFASALATNVASAESIKTYIDNNSNTAILDSGVDVFGTVNPVPGNEYVYTAGNNDRNWTFDFIDFSIGEYITLYSTPSAGTVNFKPFMNGVQPANTAERNILLEPGAVYKAYKHSNTSGDIRTLKVSQKNYQTTNLSNNVEAVAGNFYRKYGSGAPAATETININISRLTASDLFYVQNLNATTTTLTINGGTTTCIPAIDLSASSTSITLNIGDIVELNLLGTSIYYTFVKQTKSDLLRSGTGSPEGTVIAPIGTLYSNLSGGASTTLYVKESGTGNTGWVAK